MKVGFDAKRAFLETSGVGNYSRSLIDALLKFKPQNEYHLYTTKTGDIYHPDPSEIHTPNTFIDTKLKSLWRRYKLTKELQKNNIDIYHGLSHDLPRGIEKTSIASVVTIHDLIFLRHPETYPLIDTKIYYAKVKHSCTVADKIIAISEQTKQDIIDYLNIDESKIEVIYQNCDDSFKRVCSPEEKANVKAKYKLPNKYLLSVGTIEKRKNQARLIEAFDKLEDKSIELVIVGQPRKKYMQEVLSKVNKNNKMRIHFYHDISFSDFPALYQSAEMLIYPSIFEGFGIPIIEALYSKTPIITSKGSCFPEAGGPDTLYVNPKDSSEIASTITRLLQNDELKNTISEKGYKFVQQFNDELMANQLQKLYESVLR
ncbi:MAG: glycosyltransferase family 4 protein [Flavobacteriales bacterium]|nr:glycosyltransferase family 4 protein [Flavobacteriales bacterium]